LERDLIVVLLNLVLEHPFTNVFSLLLEVDFISQDVSIDGDHIGSDSRCLLDELGIRVASVVLHHKDSEEIVHGSEQGVTISVDAGQELWVVALDTEVQVVEAPRFVVVGDLNELAAISISEVEVDVSSSELVSLLDSDARWIGPELFVELHGITNQWIHPGTKAILGEEVRIRVEEAIDA